MGEIPDHLNRRNAWIARNRGSDGTSIDTATLEYRLNERSHKIKNTDYKLMLEGWLRTSGDVIQIHTDEETIPEQKILGVTNLLEIGLALGFFGTYKRDFAADKHKTQTIGDIYNNAFNQYSTTLVHLFKIAKQIGIDTEEYERRAKEFTKNFKVTNVSKPLFTLNNRNRRLQELLSAKAEIQRPIDLLAHPDTYDPNVGFRDLVGVSFAEYNAGLYALIEKIVKSNYKVSGIDRIGFELKGREHPLQVWEHDAEKLQGMVYSAKIDYLRQTRQNYESLINKWFNQARNHEKDTPDLVLTGYYMILGGRLSRKELRLNEILDRYRSKIIGTSAKLISKIEDDDVRTEFARLYDAVLNWQVK